MPFPVLLGISALVSTGVSWVQGTLNRKNTEKAHQLQVHQHHEIARREQDRSELQERIEYARLMCQRVQQQESLSSQQELAELSRQLQVRENSLSRDFQRTQQQDSLLFHQNERNLDRSLTIQENSLNRDLQRAQQQENLAFQQHERNLDRSLTIQENSLNRELQRAQQQENLAFQQNERNLDRSLTIQENSLNRDLQLTIVELNQEFQTNQGEISRAFAEKLEIFKADLQKYFFEQQRELQIELKAQDVALARELRQFDRATAISVVQEQKRQNTSPIWLVAEDLLAKGNFGEILPLHIFFSPPTLTEDIVRENPDAKGFPNIKNYLQDELRKLFQKYATNQRPNDYLAGAWTSNKFASEAAARTIFIGLQGEPTLILEATLESENISINFAYWGLGDVKERYVSVMSFSWIEALYDFAKIRTENWFRNRTAEGTTEAEWIADYGEELVRKYQANQTIVDREQRCIKQGEDIREISRKYHLAPKDYDELKRYIAIYHCLVAGWIADEYFLLGVTPDARQPPLLPDLLPDLLAGTSLELQAQICAESSAFYQNLYQRLLVEIPDWEPELRLELATTLVKLPNHEAAIAQINASLTAWLSHRNINWQPTEPVLPLLAVAAKPEDERYLLVLYSVWQLVGITDTVEMGSAYYRRGDDFFKRGNYAAAIADFDRSLNLGYAEAAQGQNMVLRFQSHLKEQEKHQQQQQENAVRQQEAATAERQRLDELNRQLEAEQQQRELLQAQLIEQENFFHETKQRWEAAEAQKQAQLEIETKQGKPFSFEIVRVNNRGEIVNREQKQARCVTENLPQGATLDKVYIPGGKFLMGSPDEEGDANEKPQHHVTLPPFFMSKYPITQAQWRAVASLPQVQRNLKSEPSRFKGDNRPVEKVSWHDAVEFCARLSNSTGQQYRLPSEAEWEYACRAGTTTPFHFGETITAKLANYHGNFIYGNAPMGEHRQETTNVGSFPPNNFGLYDLHGNVWEWCADTWQYSYTGAPTDGTAWTNGNKDLSSLRGGSWVNHPTNCRSAYRYNNNRVNLDSEIGFRVVSPV